MLRLVKIATSNFIGYLGLELGFAFEIHGLDSESFNNFVSSSDHRPTLRNRAKGHLGLSCHMQQNSQCLKRKNINCILTMIAYMKILFATSKEFIAPSLLNHTRPSLLLPFATPSDKVSNLLICMIVSKLIVLEVEDKNEETNQSTVPVLWLSIKMILKLSRLGPTVYAIGHVLLTTAPVTLTSSLLYQYIWSLFELSSTLHQIDVSQERLVSY